MGVLKEKSEEFINWLNQLKQEGMANDMPESIDDLFLNRGKTYYLNTNESLDNFQSMDLFINEVGLQHLIVLNEGTQIQISHSDFPYNLQVDAGGCGDFYSHKFDVTISKWDESIDEDALYY